MNYKTPWYACSLASILMFCYTLEAQERNLIEKIHVSPQTVRFTLNKEFHKKFLLEDLFVTYQDDIDLTKLDYTILTMPLVMNVYSMVLLSGKDYYIDAIDKDLYHSLTIVNETLKRFFPSTTWNGRLIARTLVDNTHVLENKPSNQGIAMPFSHGLDSVCTSLLHRETPQLLMTVRGCPDTPLDTWDKNWRVTKQAITHFARIHGHATSFVTSNFHEFFNWDVLSGVTPEILNWRMDTIEDLGWIGIAAPILVTKGYKKFILAANKDWSTLHPGISCPVTNDTMSFAGITVQNDAFELSRTEKNFAVARICNEHNLEKPTTYVCEHNTSERKNCCECTKCVFTILAWILAQEDPRSYGFDVGVTSFLRYFRYSYFPEHLYSPYRTGCVKYMQLKANAILDELNEEVFDFFSWFLTINFDKLTVPTPQITIDYDAMRDLYAGIPENWKTYRTELEMTHIPDILPESEYQKIWHNYKTPKKHVGPSGRKRRVKKRT